MAKLEIRGAEPADADYVAAHLRQADIVEIMAAQSDTPAVAIRRSYRWADWIRVAVVDDLPCVLYGVAATNIPDVGSPWMLATDDIKKISRQFLIRSHGEVDAMLSGYRMLFNRVHYQNDISIRWLRWLGFRVDSVLDGEFFQFWMHAKNV